MTGTETLEVERKFEVRESDELPDFASIPQVSRVKRGGDRGLDAVYFDTPDLALATQRITLRRRTGGTDAGWHLKLPGSRDERREVTEPLTGEPESVPPRLRSLVLVHVRNQALVPVAHLKTRRTPVALLAADGSVLAEFSDDRVESTLLAEPVESAAWREWEIELVDGGADLLDTAEQILVRLGHPRAAFPSKLARALGPRYPQDRTTLPHPHRKGPASSVLLAYLHDQTEALKAHDPGIREGAPDAVHQFRVAGRRIRSVLSTYRKLTDRDAAEHLRQELKWLSGSVGGVRDLEVIRDHLMHAVSDEPAELDTGPAQRRLHEHFASRSKAATDQGVAALESDRYFRILDSLETFLASPPLTKPGNKKAIKEVRRLVNKERRRVKEKVKAFHRTSDPSAAGTALHEVRKAAKRLRYASESATPVFGKKAAGIASAAEEIQTILGEHQDSLICRGMLQSMVAEAPPGAGVEEGFTFGRLHAREQQRGAEARAGFEKVWRTTRPKRLHQKR